MAISDKTRKTLWARSGNRCAMCRVELVSEKNEHERNLNIGDECHIISSKPGGPRHVPDYGKNYDGYENLILLCKNHHKTIDELWETYTDNLLRLIKSNHEIWIKTAIEAANRSANSNRPKFLPRITSGKMIVDIINSAHAFRFDHDEFRTKEEADFVASFLQNLQDWGDVSSFSDFEIGKIVQLGFELNDDIKALEAMGFCVFGERTKSHIRGSNKQDLGLWEIATIVVLHSDNPSIIDLDKMMSSEDKKAK
jgi:hypothetical protein